MSSEMTLIILEKIVSLEAKQLLIQEEIDKLKEELKRLSEA